MLTMQYFSCGRSRRSQTSRLRRGHRQRTPCVFRRFGITSVSSRNRVVPTSTALRGKRVLSKNGRGGSTQRIADFVSKSMARQNVSVLCCTTIYPADLYTVIARMQQMNIVVDEISIQAREAASMYEASLEPFSAGFDRLLGQHGKEFDRLRLDEVVVAAIAPVVSCLTVCCHSCPLTLQLDEENAYSVATAARSHSIYSQLPRVATRFQDGRTQRDGRKPGTGARQQYSHIHTGSRVCTQLFASCTPY